MGAPARFFDQQFQCILSCWLDFWSTPWHIRWPSWAPKNDFCQISSVFLSKKTAWCTVQKVFLLLLSNLYYILSTNAKWHGLSQRNIVFIRVRLSLNILSILFQYANPRLSNQMSHCLIYWMEPCEHSKHKKHKKSNQNRISLPISNQRTKSHPTFIIN